MRTLFTAFAVLFVTTAQAQFLSPGVFDPAPEGYCISIDEVITHAGGELDGMTTYRVNLNCLNATDYLSSCSGDETNELVFATTTGSFWNSSANTSWNASGISTLFLGVFPELAYDSFLTIGATDGSDPSTDHPSTVWGSINPTVYFAGDVEGQNFTVNDNVGGAWYTPFPGASESGSHVAFAGADLQICIMQITTAGTISGQVQLQVFMNADQGQEWRDVLEFGGCPIPGCTDSTACNYDSTATEDDGSCQYVDDCGTCGGTEYAGCTDETACNYDSGAGCDDGSCTYIADGECDCEGNVEDDCGNCGGMDYAGCTDATACNYDSGASCDDGSCTYIGAGECDCDGNVLDGCGNCGGDSYAGCTDMEACNYDAGAGCDDDSCTYIADGACDCDGNVEDVCGECGGTGYAGCTNPASCNYDAGACVDDGSCQELDCAGICGGTAVIDACGVCAGPGAIYECGCSDIPDGDCDCNGNVEDECGICGGTGYAGCTDTMACNYDSGAGCDNGSCTYIGAGECDCEGNVLDGCGNCGGMDYAGCTDMEACNYDEGAGCDDGSCTYIAAGACDCDGNVVDVCGVCGGMGYAGCTNPAACNYDAGACSDDGSCQQLDCAGICGGTAVLDACGVCAGPGAVYECGCNDIPEGDCDCNGNQVDECGVCGGDGIDDGACDCDGNVLDDCGVCGGSNDTCNPDLCDPDWTIYITDCAAVTLAPDEVLIHLDNGDLAYNDVDNVIGIWYLTEECLLVHEDGNGYVYVIYGLEEGNMVDVNCLSLVSLPPGSNSQSVYPNSNADLLPSAQGGCIYGATPEDVEVLGCEEECVPCETPLTWSEELSSYTVECAEEIPSDCDSFASGVMAVNECDGSEYEAVCTLLDVASQPACNYPATTAKRDAELGDGEYAVNDGALRIYALSALGGADSDYFVEDPTNPLSFRYNESTGTASLKGRVYCRENAGQWFDVDAIFGMAQTASEWLAEDPNHQLMINDDPNQAGYQQCEIDEDEIIVLDMLNPSALIGGGDLEGTLLIEHMPVSLNKRFQLGEGANNHNCEFGFGGWFKWSGELNGEYMEGNSGDVVVDLGSCSQNDSQCAEYATFNYRAYDSDCNRLFTEEFVVNREDTTPPTITDGPADATVECDNVPVMPGIEAITATDNCAGGVIVSPGEEVVFPGSCPDAYFIQRRWTVTDACGNTSVHLQNITVEDNTSPSFSSMAMDSTVECGEGNDAALTAWVESRGGAVASDNCGEVTWSNDFEGLSDLCGETGSATVTFTATDDCGNVSTTTATFTVEDTTPCAITADASINKGCEEYSSEVAYATTSDDCSDCELTWEDNVASGGCLVPVGAYLRTYTATDACGNTSTFEQTIVLVDDEAPTITVIAGDATVECDGMGNEAAFDAWLGSQGGAEANDNCGNVSWSNDYEGHETVCGMTFSATVTFTATDDCGNESTTQATFTVEDTTAPGFDNVPASYSAECSDDHPLLEAEASDVCGGTTVTVDADTTMGDCPSSYVVVRTFTAQDDCGNTRTATQTITIDDTTAPTFTSVPADYQAECSDAHPLEMAVATDNCGSVTVTVQADTLAGDCVGDYSVTRTFTAMDACGNSTTASQTITIVDTTAPVFEAFAPTTVVECTDGDGDDLAYMPLTATDNCGNVTYSVESICMSGGCLWTLLRIWTATDDCGNSTTVEQYLMLADTTAPVVTAPADFTTSAGADCGADVSTSVAGVLTTYSDNCGSADCWGIPSLTVDYEDSGWTYTCSSADGLSEGTRTMTRTWSVTDRCGNVGYADQTITIVDDTAPMGSVENDSVPCASYDASTEYGSHSETDNCDSNVSVSWENTAVIPGEGAGCYTVERTYTFMDDCGNSSSQTQTITVYDDVAPTGSGEVEVQIECSDYPDNTIYITGSDDCGSVTITFEDSQTSGGCVQPTGMYARLYTITDECGNSSNFEQYIRLVDTTAPVISAPADYTAECDEELTYEAATVSDNCDSAVSMTMSTDTIPGNCPQNFTIKRTWTATDDCDNSSTATQMITVQDTTAPVLSIPSDYTAECSEDHPLESATATDNCGMVNITVQTDTVAGACAQAYTVTRAFTATDECGNASSATQTITIVDTTAPSFNEELPMDMTVECDNVPDMVTLTATDNCQGVMVTPSSSIAPGNCPGNYTISRSWSVSDDCGNTSSHTQTITVQDTTAPELTVPADYTIECSEELILDDAEASDNCGEVNVTVQEEIVTQAPSPAAAYFNDFEGCSLDGFVATGGSISITSNAYEGSCAVYMTHYAGQVPHNFYPEDMMFGLGTYEVMARADGFISDNIMRVFAGDDYNSPALNVAVLPQNTDNPGVHVTGFGVDIHLGAPAVSQDQWFKVTLEVLSTGSRLLINDAEIVSFDTPADLPDAGRYKLAAVYQGTYDNMSFVPENENNGCPQNYDLVRTFTATDDCGNSTTKVQTITVQDTTAPVIDAQEEVFIACADYDPSESFASATDNCGLVTLTWEDSEASGGCVLPTGRYTRLYTATDECGNTSTYEQMLTLTDDIAPTFDSVPADYTVECSDDITYADATASDNCSGVTVTVEEETVAGSCPHNYQIKRTFTATDNCDNTTEAVQWITVQDTTAPELTVPASYTVECSDEMPMDDAMATDNCGEVTIEEVQSIVPGSCAGDYQIVRSFTATDECGNESTGTQTIVVTDTTSPVFTFVPADYTAECSDDHPMETPVVTDNCGEVTLLEETETTQGNCTGDYTITRTFTASDDCGNETVAVQVISIVDTTCPVLTIPADYTVECDSEVTYEDASAVDNCGTATLELTTDTILTDCDQVYSIVRTFTATDDCGNSCSESQTISVVDTTAPTIQNAGGLMNGETVEVCCEALEGDVTIPAAVMLAVSDNCDANPVVDYNEDCVGGNCPTETVESWCDISNPGVMPDGQTCDNYALHSLRLFNFPGSEFYTTVEGRVANNTDGTKTYTMTVVSTENPNAGWTITNHYGAPMTWTEWLAQPGLQSYKSDCGLGDHTEWMYTTLTSGVAEGWGDYEGDELMFSHQPASGYFGFQIGEGANNKNGNYGFSAWMYFTGTFDGETISGSGDIFGDLDCCLPYDLERSYVVSDCAGNETHFGYTVHLTGESCDAGNQGTISDQEDADLTPAKDFVKIVSLQPNPTSNASTLVLSTEEPSVTVEVLVTTMSGAEVLEIYNGQVVAGWQTTLEIPASSLESGMYQVRVRAKQFVTTKKLLVAN